MGEIRVNLKAWESRLALFHSLWRMQHTQGGSCIFTVPAEWSICSVDVLRFKPMSLLFLCILRCAGKHPWVQQTVCEWSDCLGGKIRSCLSSGLLYSKRKISELQFWGWEGGWWQASFWVTFLFLVRRQEAGGTQLSSWHGTIPSQAGQWSFSYPHSPHALPSPQPPFH